MSLGDFSQQAAAYGRSRPTYAEPLLDMLAADAELAAGDAVADFGAGTGILTRMLVDRGYSVTAIEPNESMRGQVQAQVPGARWIAGTFEQSFLEDASQRWAVAAQAFHWANPARSLPEIRRVLAPGRLFTVLWNQRASSDSEPLRWTEHAIRRHIPNYDEAYRNRTWGTILESTGDFALLNHRTARHTIQMSRDRFLDLWRSHNRLSTIAGPQRFASLLFELEEYLRGTGLKTFDIPYTCEAWSARRVG